MIQLPEGSIYFWMYTQGLKHVPLSDIVLACQMAGVEIRQKDEQNYWNGWYRSDMYSGPRRSALEFGSVHAAGKNYFQLEYRDYPVHPYLGQPDPANRFVPCDKDNRPLIKWSSGCLEMDDARAYKDAVYLGENLKGCKFIVVDCDGDHGDELDLDTIRFLSQFRTHRLSKPGDENTVDGMPVSFHLTFRVDRVIPTMHFPKAHVDIVGNRHNSLRYFKNKEWNGVEPIDMTDEIWDEIKSYIRTREES